MEGLPCAAFRMWLFPAEEFKERIALHGLYIDVFAVRPGLFLLDL